MQLVGVQLDIAWEDREANHGRVAGLLAQSPPAAESLVVLPEMFSSGFSMNVERIAEGESRPTEHFIRDLARRYGIWLVAGLATRGPDGRGRNEALAAGPGGDVVARYQKIHPFAPGREAEHYTGGDAIVTFGAGQFTAAPFVCYDLRFPEIFRAGMQRGANLLLVMANWPAPRVEHWVTLLRARAIENQAYVIGVNRCGSDPYLPYPGRSMVIDFRGSVLCDAGAEEGIISASADLDALRAYRRELPFLNDTKADLSALFR